MKNIEIIIKITDIVGDNLCISSEDGEKVYQKIVEALKEGERISLSFEGVQDLTSAFLNAAVGPLYNSDFSEQFISENLKPIKATNEDLYLLKRVVDRAKEFFKNPDREKAAIKEVLGEDD